MDILCNLGWSKLDVKKLVQKIPDNYEAAERQMRQIYLSDSSNGQPIQDKHITSSTEDNRYDRAYADALHLRYRPQLVVGVRDRQ